MNNKDSYLFQKTISNLKNKNKTFESLNYFYCDENNKEIEKLDTKNIDRLLNYTKIFTLAKTSDDLYLIVTTDLQKFKLIRKKNNILNVLDYEEQLEIELLKLYIEYLVSLKQNTSNEDKEDYFYC